jgi:transposase InsO family protein
MAVFSVIGGWYNPARRHSGIGSLSPIAYETQMTKQPQQPK